MRLVIDNNIFADLLKQLSTSIGITFVVAKLPQQPERRWTNVDFVVQIPELC